MGRFSKETGDDRNGSEEKTSTEEFLQSLRTSLVDSHSEWYYWHEVTDFVGEDEPTHEYWLANDIRKIYLRWTDEPSHNQVPNTEYDINEVVWLPYDQEPHGCFHGCFWSLDLTKEQATEVMTWRDEWKATYALRKLLK